MLQGDALGMKQFFKHASCRPTTVLTQFDNFNHVNEDATDEILARTIAILSVTAHRPLNCLLRLEGKL